MRVHNYIIIRAYGFGVSTHNRRLIFFSQMENVDKLDTSAHEALERELKLEYLSEEVTNYHNKGDNVSSFQKLYDGIWNSFIE